MFKARSNFPPSVETRLNKDGGKEALAQKKKGANSNQK